MRVLHIIARLNLGGTARYITRLAEELPKKKIETFIATGYVQGSESEDPSADYLDIIRIPSLGRAINPIKDHFAYEELQEIVKELQPDIIHTHTFKAGFITRLKTKQLKKVAKKNIKFVHTFHGHLFDDPEFSGLKAKVITQIEKRLAQKTDKLVTVGNQVATDLLNRGIGKKKQFLNIPPGVDPLKLQRAKARKEITVGWIARMTGVKNPHRALEVARNFPKVKFLLAGGGNLLTEIIEKAPKNVTVLGWTNAAELFAASDIILSTSENEGMPIALIEAQLASKPVVATNVGSVAEVVINEKTGFVTKKSTKALSQAVEQLINSKTLRTQMGKASKKHAEENFSVKQMIASHVALYKSLTK